MVQEKNTKGTQTKKLADPTAATIDPASRQVIEHAHELSIETAFDRAVTMKPLRLKIRASSWKSRNGWGSTQQLTDADQNILTVNLY
jgi:carbon-monoxide dehydrogenase catalytic subunit